MPFRSICLWMGAALGGSTPRTANGWVDPDGTNNGQNTVTQTNSGSSQVAAASRLNLTLPSPVYGSVTIQARLAISGAGGGDVPGGSITYEISTDGGTTFPTTGLLISGAGTGTVTVPGIYAGAGKCVIRLLTTATETRGSLNNTTATSFIYATAFNTDNYAVTYQSR